MVVVGQEKSLILPDDASRAKDWARFIGVKRLVRGLDVAAAPRVKLAIQRVG
jgi:hypothetical protein